MVLVVMVMEKVMVVVAMVMVMVVVVVVVVPHSRRGVGGRPRREAGTATARPALPSGLGRDPGGGWTAASVAALVLHGWRLCSPSGDIGYSDAAAGAVDGGQRC